MYATTILTLAGLAVLQPAAADFIVFLGAQNNFSGGDGSGGGPVNGPTNQVWFFNNPPSCSDGGGVLQATFYNDVSSSYGYACDGCNYDPYIPSRLEIHDGDGTFFENGGDEPHFTIYKDLNQEGNYNIVTLDGDNIGTCSVPDNKQDYTCARGPTVADSALETFRCKTALSIRDSN